MRVIAVIVSVVFLLSGCSVVNAPENVLDVYDIPVSSVNRQLVVSLPEGTSQAVMESGTGGIFYLCDGFSVSVSTLNAGDLERSVREVTGFEKDSLTILKTTENDYKRYSCAWTCMGEGTEQSCRAVILDDGSAHYAVTVMCDYEDAGYLCEKMTDVLDSVKLVSTD